MKTKIRSINFYFTIQRQLRPKIKFVILLRFQDNLLNFGAFGKFFLDINLRFMKLKDQHIRVDNNPAYCVVREESASAPDFVTTTINLKNKEQAKKFLFAYIK